MIRYPTVGQWVQAWYAYPKRMLARAHGKFGIIRILGRGPGPLNHGVEIEGLGIVVIPRGNLRHPPIARELEQRNLF